jgi:hypothetical protein
MAERFKIPIDGDSGINFYTKVGTLLASGYIRIVIGGRGPYIEFESGQIVHKNIYIPSDVEYKLRNDFSYYHEYRSRDESYVKLYYQRMEVSYADYKVGKWYIDPLCLKTDKYDDLLFPMYEDIIEKTLEEKETLFDVL